MLPLLPRLFTVVGSFLPTFPRARASRSSKQKKKASSFSKILPLARVEQSRAIKQPPPPASPASHRPGLRSAPVRFTSLARRLFLVAGAWATVSKKGASVHQQRS
jgi:hypothetical protein